MTELIKQAAEIVRHSDAIFISVGAGIGVDSGLPDFRGNKGFWKAYPLLGDERLSFQDLANPVWFESDPYRAWGFYGHRLNLYQSTTPYEGFTILKKWCDSKPLKSFIFTTNVDGHFQKAGFAAEQVCEYHGSIHHLQCTKPCNNNIWPVHRLDLKIDENALRAEGELPCCPNCGEVARPNILMFNDFSWLQARSTQQNRLFERWVVLNSNLRTAVIEIDAGKSIPTARLVSESIPAQLIRINPRDADGPKGTISISLGSLGALSVINELLNRTIN
jgi:NAD-dependent SIR2 family protein deacetylase